MTKLSDEIKKVYENEEVQDQPFPEVPAHTHNGVDSQPLAPQSVGSTQLKENAVSAGNLMDLSVTEEKLAAAAVATSKIKDDAVTAAKVYKAGSVITLSAQIAEAVIITAHIQDLAVKWAKIGNLEVGNSKIMDAAISRGKIQDLAVDNAKIENETITNSKIGLLQVGNSRIMDAAISTAKIQDLAVGWAELANMSVGNSKIMNAAISTAKIQDAAITDAEIGWLNAGKITAGTMSADRVWGGALYSDYVHIRMCGQEALNVAGNINKTGWSNFVIPHPLQKGKLLVYTAPEAAEVLLIHRGSDKLINGERVVTFPAHFQAVSDPRKVTAYVTARDDCNGLFVKELDKAHMLVKECAGGSSNAAFDFFVFTIREGAFDKEFEPDGELLLQRDGESNESFRERFREYRIKQIKKQGGDIEKKIAEFNKAWQTTPAVINEQYVQPK
ncbi:MAG: Phage protein [Candidatus Woesebacteria bacterium]|nr:MAG: Phage protein [Candidatus Woesebacteria bacterium]